jgi:hypothetical protein
MCLPNGHKLIAKEEKTLENWILSLNMRDFPSRVQMITHMVNLLLANRGTSPPLTVGQNWATNYVKRYNTLKTAYF